MQGNKLVFTFCHVFSMEPADGFQMFVWLGLPYLFSVLLWKLKIYSAVGTYFSPLNFFS